VGGGVHQKKKGKRSTKESVGHETLFRHFREKKRKKKSGENPVNADKETPLQKNGGERDSGSRKSKVTLVRFGELSARGKRGKQKN